MQDSASSWLLALALPCLACSGQPAPRDAGAAAQASDSALDAAPRGGAPLEHGRESLESLGRTVVEALNADDLTSLRRLVITEQEYKGRLFAALANHPTALQMGPELLWDMQSRESDDDLGHIVERYGGRSLEFVAIEPEGVERRDGVTLHRRPAIVVREPGDPTPRRVKILASVVQHDATDTFKLIAYRLGGGDR